MWHCLLIMLYKMVQTEFQRPFPYETENLPRVLFNSHKEFQLVRWVSLPKGFIALKNYSLIFSSQLIVRNPS